ncbi:IS21-like element helper ATPase IstB [Peptoclostridium litorale]|uniref:IS21-like element helper ATPase IstB n=1 Tax=Peptoclostridium litorale TaxID=1557 RepID=UPI0009816808|nr:IS21-like element helper ATPase IstB [Peptoclostridium litorale]
MQADTNEEFLLKLLQAEVVNREIIRKKRLLKNAEFDVIKTFQDYSFDNIEIPKSISIETIQKASFIGNKENLILYGAVGTGKTHMATAIGVQACNQGKEVKFIRTASLVNQLSEAKASGSLKKYIKKIQNCELLIFDEWGYVPFEKEGAQLLLQIISECYEKRSVIITTNLQFSQWNGIFYDEKMTSAIIDRLIHHSHLLIFDGPSYRLKHSTINC